MLSILALTYIHTHHDNVRRVNYSKYESRQISFQYKSIIFIIKTRQNQYFEAVVGGGEGE